MSWKVCSATLALMLTLALGSEAAAQNFTIGAKGGYALSDATDVTDASSKGGLVVGAYLNIGFGPGLFVRPEALYVERKIATPGVGGDDTFKQSYVDVPVLVGYRLGTGMLQPSLYAGPVLSFETQCKIDESGATSMDCSDIIGATDTKSTLWSAGFGVNLDIVLAVLDLHGDVRYNLGLSNIFEGSGTDEKWNTWMFMVGAGFRLGN